MKTLARNLSMTHGMKPGEYRKQFNIPPSQPLTAKSFSEGRRKVAMERGLADNLTKARAARVEMWKWAKPALSKSSKHSINTT